MAESVTIARPYAQAVFRLAKEGRSLAAWSDRLRRLAAIAADPEMGNVVGNPKFSAGQIADLFMALSGEPENRELASFIALLAENGRFDVLAEISAIFRESQSAAPTWRRCGAWWARKWAIMPNIMCCGWRAG